MRMCELKKRCCLGTCHTICTGCGWYKKQSELKGLTIYCK